MGIMSKDWFDAIKQVFPFAFYDYAAEKEGDPWHPIGLLVYGFNKNHHFRVAASCKKIMDESMSAWKPRTTPLGGLPFLSFILWKPKPLGTEFKNIACSVTGIMLHLEIQHGKIPMQKAKHSEEHGATTGCTMRLCEESRYSGMGLSEQKEAKKNKKKEHYEGDLWFESVKAAENIALEGHEFGGPVSIINVL